MKLDSRVFTGETMDTERFQKNIEQADSNSLRIGAANVFCSCFRNYVIAIMKIVQNGGYGNYVRMQRIYVITLVRLKLQLLLMKETKRLYLSIMERLFP